MPNPKFDPRKALEILLYVTQQCRDIYTALKVVYFADKAHLSRYGRLIAGDRYVAMRHGPVPSGLYDIIKAVRGDGAPLAFGTQAKEAFAIEGNSINPIRRPDLSVLSESDKECLDQAIREYGHKSFDELKRLSHDAAFDAADENDFIAIEALARSLPNGEALLEYLNL
jgi:uncharacterized phage-associated protein